MASRLFESLWRNTFYLSYPHLAPSRKESPGNGKFGHSGEVNAGYQYALLRRFSACISSSIAPKWARRFGAVAQFPDTGSADGRAGRIVLSV